MGFLNILLFLNIWRPVLSTYKTCFAFDLCICAELFELFQFKVLRGGSWHNINFKRESPHIHRANECHDLNGNPWIQHFRSSSKQGSVTSPAIEETATSTMNATSIGRRRGLFSGSPTCSRHIHICKSLSSKQDVLCDDTGALKFSCLLFCQTHLSIVACLDP